MTRPLPSVTALKGQSGESRRGDSTRCDSTLRHGPLKPEALACCRERKDVGRRSGLQTVAIHQALWASGVTETVGRERSRLCRAQKPWRRGLRSGGVESCPCRSPSHSLLLSFLHLIPAITAPTHTHPSCIRSTPSVTSALAFVLFPAEKMKEYQALFMVVIKCPFSSPSGGSHHLRRRRVSRLSAASSLGHLSLGFRAHVSRCETFFSVSLLPFLSFLLFLPQHPPSSFPLVFGDRILPHN